MLTKILAFLLGFITYPITRKIFEIAVSSLPGNERVVLIVFFVTFSLMALGAFFILRRIFGFAYLLGLVIGFLFSTKFWPF